MGRYYKADDVTKNLMESLLNERFAEFANVNIEIIMDSKLKIDKLNDKVVLASIKLTNDVEKYLTSDYAVQRYGHDYFIFINELAWELADEKDKKRIMSHELRHMFIDDNGNYKVRKHDIEDFIVEIKLNEDDPEWGNRLSTIVNAKYEQMKEEAKNN